MPRLPTLSYKQVYKILLNLGFEKERQKGSHVFFLHKNTRATVVPKHGGKDIGRGLLRSIIRDTGITPKEFIMAKKKKQK